MKKFQLALTMLAALASPAWAASQTVTLSLPTMDCTVCPITVKKALGRVAGVSDTKVNFDKREATVVFDHTRTNVEALSRATQDAGYPSTLARSSR